MGQSPHKGPSLTRDKYKLISGEINYIRDKST